MGNGGAYPDPSDADIACVLIYDRMPADDERQLVKAWLGDVYGIAVTPTLGTLVPPISALNVNNADGQGHKIFEMDIVTV